MAVSSSRSVGKVLVRLHEVAKKHGVINRKGPHKGKISLRRIELGTGISYKTLYTLMKHPENVYALHLETVAKLCSFIGCTPGELLEYVADERNVEYTPPERRATAATPGNDEDAPAISNWEG